MHHMYECPNLDRAWVVNELFTEYFPEMHQEGGRG